MQNSNSKHQVDIELSIREEAKQKENKLEQNHDMMGEDTPTIVSIVGEFGIYQLSVVILTFIRFIDVAMMTNTGPLIAPTVDFWCQVSNETIAIIFKPENVTVQDYLKNRCTIEVTGGAHTKCTSWTYNTTEHGKTLTDTFDLVCDDDWLRSLFQSVVSVGVVVAAVICGSFSDRHGRNVAIRVCFVGSLITGLVSYYSPNFVLYTISRSLCSFSDLGLVVSMSTMMVELLGNKYRSACSLIVYTGWAFGVMIMPWTTSLIKDFRALMLFTTINHLITLPWILMLGESTRWLLINGRIGEAQEELRRISRWNKYGRTDQLADVDRKFSKLSQKFILKQQKRDTEPSESKSIGREIFLSTLGGLANVSQLFKSRELMITTFTLVWTTFNSEFFYMLFIMINSDIGDDIKLNYAIGGLMETLATILAVLMAEKLTRKFSLVSTLICISSLCLLLAFVHDNPQLSVWVLNASKLAISTLSSMVYVTTTEIFPTSLRQTGYGVTGTLGSMGAVIAPFIRTELADIIGMTKVMFLIFSLPLTCAALIPFHLRETKGVELADDVDEFVGANQDNTSSVNEHSTK